MLVTGAGPKQAQDLSIAFQVTKLQGIAQSFPDIGPAKGRGQAHPVDHNEKRPDRITRPYLFKPLHPAVHKTPGVSTGYQVLQAMASGGHRGPHYEDPVAMRSQQMGQQLQDIIHSMLPYWDGAVRTMELGHPGVQVPDRIGDICQGGHGGPCILYRITALDCNGGWQSCDECRAGARALFQELSDIGGEGFDEPSLGLGMDCVEHQGGFACTRWSNHCNGPVEGDIHVDCLQVVFPEFPQFDLPCHLCHILGPFHG